MEEHNEHKYEVFYFENKTHRLHMVDKCINIINSNIKKHLNTYLQQK
jgi:hypothetical protein